MEVEVLGFWKIRGVLSDVRKGLSSVVGVMFGRYHKRP